MSEKHDEVLRGEGWRGYAQLARLANADSATQQPGEVVLGVGSDDDAEYWERNFGPGLRSSDSAGGVQAGPRVVVEDKPLGSFLGTVLAFAAPDGGELVSSDVVGATYVAVFGEGRRLSPITQALGGIKPALRLLRLSDQHPQPASVAELAYAFCRPINDWLTACGFEGLLLKWGDEIQIPSAVPGGLDLSSADIVRFGSSDFDLEANAAQKDWLAYDPVTSKLSGLISRQDPASLRSRTEDLARSGRTIMLNAGTFAISRRLLEVLVAEFHPEIAAGSRLDWDPLVMSALLAETDEDWRLATELADGSPNPALASQLDYVPNLRDRMQQVRDRFRQRYGADIVAKGFDLGEILWLDCGLHRPMFDLLAAMLDDDERGATVRQVFGIDAAPDEHGNRIINSSVAPGARVRNSLIVDSILRADDSVVDRGVVVGSAIGSVSLPSGGAVLYTTVQSLRGTGPRSLAYLYHGDSLDLGPGGRVSTVYVDGEPQTLHSSEDLPTSGDEWYLQPVLDNRLSFAEARDAMRTSARYPFD